MPMHCYVRILFKTSSLNIYFLTKDFCFYFPLSVAGWRPEFNKFVYVAEFKHLPCIYTLPPDNLYMYNCSYTYIVNGTALWRNTIMLQDTICHGKDVVFFCLFFCFLMCARYQSIHKFFKLPSINKYQSRNCWQILGMRHWKWN